MMAIAVLAWSTWSQAEPSFVRNGETGFVLSHIEYALADDAEKTGACAAGMTMNANDIFAGTPGGARRRGESDEAYGDRLKAGGKALSIGPQGEDLCLHPEAGKPDPHFRTVEGGDIPVFGIDIDGVVSAGGDNPGRKACSHHDFVGRHGEPGVDNQFFRVIGCITPSSQAVNPIALPSKC